MLLAAVQENEMLLGAHYAMLLTNIRVREM
jgi:hypothetical protein